MDIIEIDISGKRLNEVVYGWKDDEQDGNSLEVITQMSNSIGSVGRMYLSEWEKKNEV